MGRERRLERYGRTIAARGPRLASWVAGRYLNGTTRRSAQACVPCAQVDRLGVASPARQVLDRPLDVVASVVGRLLPSFWNAAASSGSYSSELRTKRRAAMTIAIASERVKASGGRNPLPSTPQRPPSLQIGMPISRLDDLQVAVDGAPRPCRWLRDLEPGEPVRPVGAEDLDDLSRRASGRASPCRLRAVVDAMSLLVIEWAAHRDRQSPVECQHANRTPACSASSPRPSAGPPTLPSTWPSWPSANTQ